MADLAFLRAKANRSLVDLRPWETAETLASLAVTAEEQSYAREAEHLSDHEVDQAFAAALRAAQLKTRHRVLKGRALVLSQHVAELQRNIAQDQAMVARLKARAGEPAGTAKEAVGSAAGNDALQMAEAQLKLDSDELTDAQRALDRVTGSLSVRLQEELAAHEVSMKKYDSEQAAGMPIAVVAVKHEPTLAGRLTAWWNQRSRYASLQQAEAASTADAQRLTKEYNALEAKENAAGTAKTLAGIEDRRTERQILSIDDDRIQTDQQLATVYGKWGNQVEVQHEILLHLVLSSVETIILIVLGMVLGDALVRRATEHPAVDRRQAATLRTILRVAVQVAGLLLIVVVVFGPPHQTATVIGLATAALTISLQDYILAFLGWFMLVGKNGIRVGDMVEINGVAGEVVDVGLMSTTLLETTGLAEKGEPTGRRVSFLNSFAIRGQCFNFSSEGQWLWDEITISVPPNENVYAIAKSVGEAAREETQESARQAEREWHHTARSTALTKMSADPIVMMQPSTVMVGIDIHVRYVTRAVGRIEVRDRLYRRAIEMLHEGKQLPAPAAACAPEPRPA